jgi:hypothetical protein
MVAKQIWIAIKAFKNVDEWTKSVNSTDKDKIHNLKIDYGNLTAKNMYKAMLGLVPKANLDIKKVNLMNMTSFALQKMILSTEKLKSWFPNEDHEHFLHKMIFNCYWTRNLYGHEIIIVNTPTWEQFLKENFKREQIGLFVSPLSSLFNHSCAPNINYCHIGKKLVTYVVRPIRKGEQIFTTYGYGVKNFSFFYFNFSMIPVSALAI